MPVECGDICESCALIGETGALCHKHAATDELLQACERAKSYLSRYGDNSLARGLVNELADAIAKARGQS